MLVGGGRFGACRENANATKKPRREQSSPNEMELDWLHTTIMRCLRAVWHDIF
jgi:hypothetical protein